MRHVLLALIVVALVSVGPAVSLAAAQAPAATTSGVVPTLGVETRFDDNIFSQPTATSDLVLRVQPGIAFGRTRSQATWTAAYGFDAEQYQQHSELASPFARQSLAFNASTRVGPRSSFAWSAGYLSTLNQSELNTLTNLNVGRVRSNHVDGNVSFRRSLTPHADVTLGSSFGRSESDQLGRTDSTAVDVRLASHVSPHADVFLYGDAQEFDITGVVNSGTHRSESVGGGWSRRGRATTVSLETGIQLNDGEPGPRVALTFERRFRSASVTTSYTRNVTTALGVGGTIAFDNVQVGLRRRSATNPRAWQAGITGGFVQNRISSSDVRAIQVMADASKPITKTLSIRLSYNRWMQQGNYVLPTSLGGRVLRNQLSVGLSISPRSSR